jgi:hypothetical protein
MDTIKSRNVIAKFENQNKLIIYSIHSFILSFFISFRSLSASTKSNSPHSAI